MVQGVIKRRKKKTRGNFGCERVLQKSRYDFVEIGVLKIGRTCDDDGRDPGFERGAAWRRRMPRAGGTGEKVEQQGPLTLPSSSARRPGRGRGSQTGWRVGQAAGRHETEVTARAPSEGGRAGFTVGSGIHSPLRRRGFGGGSIPATRALVTEIRRDSTRALSTLSAPVHRSAKGLTESGALVPRRWLRLPPQPQRP